MRHVRQRIAALLPIAVVAIIAMFGLWLLLVDTYERPELVAATAAAVLCAGAGAILLRDEISWRALVRESLGLWRLPLLAVRDTAVVLTAMLLHAARIRPLRSGFRVEPSQVGRGLKVEVHTRRAVVTLTRSFPPNSAVVGFNERDDTVVFHELVPRGEPVLQQHGASRTRRRPPGRSGRRRP